MGRYQQVVVQLERAKRLIRDEIQVGEVGKRVETLKMLDRIIMRLGGEDTIDCLPHRL